MWPIQRVVDGRSAGGPCRCRTRIGGSELRASRFHFLRYAQPTANPKCNMQTGQNRAPDRRFPRRTGDPAKRRPGGRSQRLRRTPRIGVDCAHGTCHKYRRFKHRHAGNSLAGPDRRASAWESSAYPVANYRKTACPRAPWRDPTFGTGRNPDIIEVGGLL